MEQIPENAHHLGGLILDPEAYLNGNTSKHDKTVQAVIKLLLTAPPQTPVTFVPGKICADCPLNPVTNPDVEQSSRKAGKRPCVPSSIQMLDQAVEAVIRGVVGKPVGTITMKDIRDQRWEQPINRMTLQRAMRHGHEPDFPSIAEDQTKRSNKLLKNEIPCTKPISSLLHAK